VAMAYLVERFPQETSAAPSAQAVHDRAAESPRLAAGTAL
jgi:hypothetical protein